MKTDQIIMCIVALFLGMVLSNILKNVCGCAVIEGQFLDNLLETTPGMGSWTALMNAGSAGINMF